MKSRRTRYYVLFNDMHKFVAVGSALFVRESKPVHQLMLDRTSVSTAVCDRNLFTSQSKKVA